MMRINRRVPVEYSGQVKILLSDRVVECRAVICWFEHKNGLQSRFGVYNEKRALCDMAVYFGFGLSEM